MCTFLFWMEHCGIRSRCIMGFVKLVYALFWDQNQMGSSLLNHNAREAVCMTRNINTFTNTAWCHWTYHWLKVMFGSKPSLEPKLIDNGTLTNKLGKILMKKAKIFCQENAFKMVWWWRWRCCCCCCCCCCCWWWWWWWWWWWCIDYDDDDCDNILRFKEIVMTTMMAPDNRQNNDNDDDG